MYLSELTVHGFRNLNHQKLVLPEGPSLFYGDNGSGKTSLLEAVHLLATGRSFRSHLIKPLIHHGEDACLVRGQLTSADSSRPAAVMRSRNGELNLRLGGVQTPVLADLAAALPLVVVDTDALSLIEGAPEQRRRFLDATLFHVEQAFFETWRRYQKALRQRNAGLRGGILDADATWLHELAVLGEKLSEMRQAIASKLTSRFQQNLAELAPKLVDCSVEYRQGWDAGLTLLDALHKGAPGDLAQGFTHAGPHRADFRLKWQGRLAAEVMSRGQLKVAVVAMKLAQAAIMAEARGEQPVFLLDDLTAELDHERSVAVFRRLADVQAQVLLTAVALPSLDALWPGSKPALFHVEQGIISSDC